jgi:hypothetical protein
MLGMKTVRVHLQAVQHDITAVAVAESSAKGKPVCDHA